MPRASVVLREGKSYRYKTYVFTETPSWVTDQKLIDELKGIGVLKVVEEDTDDDKKTKDERKREALAATGPKGDGSDKPLTGLPPAEGKSTSARAAEAKAAVGMDDDDKSGRGKHKR